MKTGVSNDIKLSHETIKTVLKLHYIIDYIIGEYTSLVKYCV